MMSTASPSNDVESTLARVQEAQSSARSAAMDTLCAGTLWNNRFAMWTSGVAGATIALGVSNSPALIALFGAEPVGLMLLLLVFAAALGVVCRLAGADEERSEIERSMPSGSSYSYESDMEQFYYEELIRTFPPWEAKKERAKLARWRKDVVPAIRMVGYRVMLQRSIIGAQLICVAIALALPILELLG